MGKTNSNPEPRKLTLTGTLDIAAAALAAEGGKPGSAGRGTPGTPRRAAYKGALLKKSKLRPPGAPAGY